MVSKNLVNSFFVAEDKGKLKRWRGSSISLFSIPGVRKKKNQKGKFYSNKKANLCNNHIAESYIVYVTQLKTQQVHIFG